ncbi:tetratricopeptide repeat protein [Tengunoibacter tsumagoiensis]|uniref:NTF2-like N-terminal transpeptidase domain-containing protein n=1 Tax=Tengunoibacter tsumagoiensis TaxID=2014871 RepID=A0A402A2T4_9CHLR|nr:tetratricopeptide repeat protein [Tengunoibacter tsumagoiensis]GCE13365.1 hypothetical protein KTT_32240 [Tengunoibacter tsumagoiensis]
MPNKHENPQVQQLLAQYPSLAHELQGMKPAAEISALLEPITLLPEEVQTAFLKALAQEKTVAAADVAMAMNTMSSQKDVRKEARKTIIRLESSEIYPQWTPPSVPTLSQAFELATEEDSELPDDAIFAELQSILAGAGNLFGGSDAEETVATFIDAWSSGTFDEAYRQLAETSPLREGLSEDEWVSRRQAWSNQAQPSGSKVAFIYTHDDGDEPAPLDAKIVYLHPTSPEQTGQPISVEIGWSLAFAETPIASTLPELPVATAIFQETGRHWFWTRYTLVEENDEWLITTMTDEGANTLQTPTEVLEERLQALQALAESLEEEDDDEDDDDNEEEDEEEFDEDDEDEEDEDDEEDDDEEFGQALAQMDEAIRMTTQSLHYYDALISQHPEAHPEYHQQAYAQAMLINEPERAAVYLQQLIEHVPELRGEALRELAFTYNTLIDAADDDEDDELAERFHTLTQQTLRQAIATDNAPAAYILLADLLLEDDETLDEAADLLAKAQKLTTDEKETALIEAGLAEVAQLRNQPAESLKHYQRVAALAPDFPNIWFHLGTLHHQLEQEEEAIPHLLRSIETNPTLIEAHAELAAIYTELGELKLARQVVQQGLEVDPESVDLTTMLALTYIQGNDLKSAEKYLQQAEALDDEGENELVQTVRSVLNQQKMKQRAQSKGPSKGSSSQHHHPKKKKK